MRNYVIFPFFEDDEVVYWQGRHISPEARLRKFNPPADIAPMGKSYWLYNMEMDIIVFIKIGIMIR
jgi:hypothetical protein